MAREEGIGGIIFNSRIRTVKCENLGKFADEMVPRQGSSCLYFKGQLEGLDGSTRVKERKSLDK